MSGKINDPTNLVKNLIGPDGKIILDAFNKDEMIQL